MKVLINSQLDYAKKFKYLLAQRTFPKGCAVSKIYEDALFDKAKYWGIKFDIKDIGDERLVIAYGESLAVLIFFLGNIFDYDRDNMEADMMLNDEMYVASDTELTKDDLYQETGIEGLFENLEGDKYEIKRNRK